MAKRIQNPVVGQALQRAFGLQGRVDPSLDEIIVPVVNLGDIGQNSPPDISGVAIARADQGGVAGEVYRARFEVPGNVLAVIQRIYVRTTTLQTFRVNFVSPGAARAFTASKAYTDGRLLDAGLSPAGVLTFGTDPAPLPTYQWSFAAPTDGVIVAPPGLVVGSGREGQFGFLEFSGTGVNTPVFLSLQWREYRVV